MQDRQVRFGAMVVASVLSFSVAAVGAQAPSGDQKAENTAAAPERLAKPAPRPMPQPAATTAIQRWFDIQTASLLMRYRKIETSAGVVTSDHLQDSLAVRARVKFDRKARYTLNAGLATGTSFTGGWNNTGWGKGGPAVTNLFVKQLFLAATPVKGLEASYGGLAFVRGESTEITSYDNDGYLVGTRVSAKRPTQLHLDDVTFTVGYVGDLTRPSVTARYTRLDEVNYRHLLVDKKVGRLLAVSTDYTRLSGVGTMRGAFALKTPRARLLDAVRYEQYRRLDSTPAWGFAAYGEKAVTRRVTLGGGYADIDARYGGANADRFNRGRRLFEQANVKLFNDLTVGAFFTQAVHNAYAVSNKHRTDVVLSYNALGPMQRAGYFK